MPGRPHLPAKHKEIALALIRSGTPKNIAYPLAIAQIAKGCLTGKTGNGGTLSVAKRAEFCKAHSEWRKTHKGTGYGKNFSGRG